MSCPAGPDVAGEQQEHRSDAHQQRGGQPPPEQVGRDDGAAGSRDACVELQVCALVRAAVGFDRVAVVTASDINTRAALRGSDVVLERFCDLQQTLVQGPSLDAFQHAVPVVVDDLRTTSRPWPLLGASTPVDLPVRSLAVLPLPNPPLTPQAVPAVSASASSGGWRQPALGVLIIGRDRLEPFTTTQVTALTHLAGVLASLLVHRAATGELAETDVDPSDDLAVVVGMLEERLDTGADEAMSKMRAHAFSAGCTIHDVARAVLGGRTPLEDVAS